MIIIIIIIIIIITIIIKIRICYIAPDSTLIVVSCFTFKDN